MNYFLFMDESGSHGLSAIDPNFPVFVLCGVLISEEDYNVLRERMNLIKAKFWGDKKVIFHSRDIRKNEKEFQIFFDLALKSEFIDDINELVRDVNYKIIAAGIRKEDYIKKYGRLARDVYEVSLSYVMERTVFCLDSYSDVDQLDIVLEHRGLKEDTQLGEHITRVKQLGTFYVNGGRFSDYGFHYQFSPKKDNINGVQLCDLLAYPIARYVIDPARANPAFDVLDSKFYRRGVKRYGLKIFP